MMQQAIGRSKNKKQKQCHAHLLETTYLQQAENQKLFTAHELAIANSVPL